MKELHDWSIIEEMDRLEHEKKIMKELHDWSIIEEMDRLERENHKTVEQIEFEYMIKVEKRNRI